MFLPDPLSSSLLHFLPFSPTAWQEALQRAINEELGSALPPDYQASGCIMPISAQQINVQALVSAL
jgi:hypothetical protein